MDRLNAVWESLSGALGPYLPRLMGALLILLVAWLAARVARTAVERLAASRRLDERLQSPGLGATFGGIAHGLVWLLSLPALLGTLELQGLLDPVNAMLSKMMGFVPSLIGAVVALAIGLLVARIVRQVLSGLLRAAGSERLAERLGLSSALGEQGLAGLAGTVAFVLILLPTLAAALQPLGLDALTNPVSRLLDTVIGLIPKLASAAIILAVAALIGRALAGVVTALLAGVGFNELPERLGARKDFRMAGRDASELAGAILMAGVMLLALMQALEVLDFSVLTEAVSGLGAVLARVVVALLVMGAGLWLASVAARMIQGSSVANARVLSALARGAILFFTAALALRQAGLPAEIVVIAFASVVGSLAIGLAVAIGVGGRHVVGRLIERAAASFERDTAGDAPHER